MDRGVWPLEGPPLRMEVWLSEREYQGEGFLPQHRLMQFLQKFDATSVPVVDSGEGGIPLLLLKAVDKKEAKQGYDEDARSAVIELLVSRKAYREMPDMG